MRTVGSTAGGSYTTTYVATGGAEPAATVATTAGAVVGGTVPVPSEQLSAFSLVSGTPQLDAPKVDVDDILENLQSLLPMFFGKGEALTQDALSEMIKSNAKVGDALAKGRMDKIREAAAKLSSADNKDFWGSVLNIAGKALLLVGAVVATVASGGTLGPVLLPMAIYSIVQSAGSLINDIMKLSGHPDGMGFELSIGYLAKVIATKSGADEETAKEWMKWTDLAVGVAMTLVSLGAMSQAGAALLKVGGSSATLGASKMGTMATKLNAITQTAGTAASIGTAFVGMSAADDRRDAEKARADNKELQALVLKGQQMALMYYEALSDALQRMSEGQERLSEIINHHGQSQKTIVNNIV